MIFIGDDDFHHHDFTLMISLVEHDFHRFAYANLRNRAFLQQTNKYRYYIFLDLVLLLRLNKL